MRTKNAATEQCMGLTKGAREFCSDPTSYMSVVLPQCRLLVNSLSDFICRARCAGGSGPLSHHPDFDRAASFSVRLRLFTCVTKSLSILL